MNVESYLGRIGYCSQLRRTRQTLRGLHVAHMRTVPFENLDIVPLHRPIRLDEETLWNKIVERKRGGFCYELNGMFGWLLKQVGFDVTYLNARVFRQDGRLGIEFDHLSLLIALPGEAALWLADVGFGNSFIEPLLIQEGEQDQGSRSYRLETTGNGYVTWQRDYEGNWRWLYFFDLTPRSFPSDYESACLYHQRSPESSFTEKPVISRATSYGRVSLEQSRLIVTHEGRRTEKPVGAEQWSGLLNEHFGVVL